HNNMTTYTSQSNWLRRNCIGRGSFGVVNLAVHPYHGALFAVKSVENNSRPFVGCLENEIRILKSLSSPYVVGYLGDDVTSEFSSSSSSSVVYRNLHIEYMSGGTVADVAKLLDGDGSGGVNLRGYTRCITAALSYIHARNIVHCDVKGKNVLIGDIPGTAKLADFGSAIELGVSVTGTRGSPLWMAPEVIRGEYQGPESDVWSLGCTVIEMFTGKPAWQDRGADTLRQIGYSDELPEFPTQAPEDLHDFLDKCLRREPRERWSCDQLLHHPFLSSCPSTSPPHMTTKLSPRCVFDWSFSSSSKESTLEIYQLDTQNSHAKQRIGKLASNSVANWESEGWEVVRHVTSESGETTSEHDDSINEEASVSGSGRANWEYTNYNASYDDDLESTTNNAQDTRGFGRYRDRYRCYMYVLIQKLFHNLKCIQHIYYTHWFTCTTSLLKYSVFTAFFIGKTPL
ncbi:mitogen-activated protein kinase kinase kinase 18-like, partial [Cynara cardunculus var. scolymus]|uniref:mitogen-activated protein kinase kinase kinase 18-like n=1 Tax=Cynara cardunculus var. scolymus TaxID=59895 RepID=UPI000D62E15D